MPPAALSGAYSGVTSNFAFLTPSLSYDANNVYLLLFQSASAFAGRRADGQPVRRRHGARPGQRHGDGRPQHRAERAERAQHPAGTGGAERHQRPAICRLRHDQCAGRGAVHEHRRPADGVGPRRRGRRPAPGAGAGLRGRGLRRREPVERLGKRARRAGFGGGQRQQFDAHLQFRRRGGRHRLSPRSALPGRPQCGLRRGQPVGRQLHGPRLDRHGERHRLRLVHPRRLLRRCPGGLRVFRQPDAAADPVPRPAAHRQRQHRRQPVPGTDRDRLSHRPLRAGRGQHHAVRAPAGLDGRRRTPSRNGAPIR